VQLEQTLPQFDFRIRHELRIHASLEDTYRAFLSARFGDSLLIRTLLWLRGLGPLRLHEGGHGDGDMLCRLEKRGFVVLSHLPCEEIVLGIAGKFWRPDGGRISVPAAEFSRFAQPGYAKAAFNFLFREESTTSTRLSTETRIAVIGGAAWWLFRMYWLAVRPFAGLIRGEMLRMVKQRAETAKP